MRRCRPAGGAAKLYNTLIPNKLTPDIRAPERSALAGPCRVPVPSSRPNWEELFRESSQPTLLLEADSGRIVAANLAAARALHRRYSELAGEWLLHSFDMVSRRRLERCLEAARQGIAHPVRVRLLQNRLGLGVAVSLFRSGLNSYLLAQLTVDRVHTDGDSAGGVSSAVFDAIESAGTGFVLTDRHLRVRYANRVFRDWVESASPTNICGESLARWILLTGDFAARLGAQMQRREAVTISTTAGRSELTAMGTVEIHAIAVPGGDDLCWGFCICARPTLN
jgi:PAS domain-containing protein